MTASHSRVHLLRPNVLMLFYPPLCITIYQQSTRLELSHRAAIDPDGVTWKDGSICWDIAMAGLITPGSAGRSQRIYRYISLSFPPLLVCNGRLDPVADFITLLVCSERWC